MNFFRQEVDAAVDALLLQQVIVLPTAAGWALGCDAEVPRAVARLHELAGPTAAPAQRLAADAPTAPDPTPTVAEFIHKLTRRLGHPVLAVPVAATFAELPAALLRQVDYVVSWGQ